MQNTEDKNNHQHVGTCPFSKFKSSNLKNSEFTPCPLINVLIKAGELDPKKKWSRQELITILRKNNIFSNAVGNLFTYALTYPNRYILFPGIEFFPFIKKPIRFSVATLQEHNLLEHDVSLSRKDAYLGDHINYSDTRFKLIYEYFKNKKSISLQELITYKHYLYEKSKIENKQLAFGYPAFITVIAEMVVIFILLSENGRLNLKKLEKVFKKESLDGVKTRIIELPQFILHFTRALHFWNVARLKYKHL